MKLNERPSALTATATLFGAALVGLLALPVVALAVSSSPAEWVEALSHPSFAPALALSLRTSLLSLLLTSMMGIPLAWWLATSTSRTATVAAIAVELPIVIPPAVVGVALLQTYGRNGLLGPAFAWIGVQVAFTEAAVVLSQIVVSAPFFVQASANAFRKVNPDAIIVARSLGATRAGAFLRVAIPAALPGLAAGASLAWARALGEFGATLLFAGNLAGRTQTMPLAIFSALEADVRLAIVFSLALAAFGALLLGAIHAAPRLSIPRFSDPPRVVLP